MDTKNSSLESSEPSEERSPIDPYRANRELERWLFNGGDQREMSEMLSRRGVLRGWRDTAPVVWIMEHVMTHDNEGNLIDIDTIYHRVEDLTDEEKDRLEEKAGVPLFNR